MLTFFTPVHSRFGFHVVEVMERKPGVEANVRGGPWCRVMSMRQKTYNHRRRQYLQQLAGQAIIIGVDSKRPTLRWSNSFSAIEFP